MLVAIRMTLRWPKPQFKDEFSKNIHAILQSGYISMPKVTSVERLLIGVLNDMTICMFYTLYFDHQCHIWII